MTQLFLQSKDNAVLASYQFAKAIGAKLTLNAIEDKLTSHPDYPSLLAVSEVFNDLNIENAAVRLSYEQFLEIPTPFLVFLNHDGGVFACINAINKSTVEWFNTSKGKIIQSKEDFFQKWNGVALLAEANDESIEKNYATNLNQQRISQARMPFILGCFSIILGFSIFYNWSSNFAFNTLFFSKLAGFICSTLLLWQGIDANNPFIKNICQIGSKVNCNSILNTSAARINSLLNWSEAGFFYFTAGFILMLLQGTAALSLLKIIGLLALPYTFWSVYYQGFVAKQWCLLCLVVQFIFIIEAILLFSNPMLLPSIEQFSFGILALALPILLWIFLKPILQNSQQLASLRKELKHFKNNPNLFLSTLLQQETMPFLSDDLRSIKIGSPKAEHTITMVTNPFCQPCARTHQILEELIANNANLNAQIIFAGTNHQEDQRGIVARTILAIDPAQQAHALQAWYAEPNLNKWLAKFESKIEYNAAATLEKQIEWCNTANITATPTIFINFNKLPELYQLENLASILKYLPTKDLQITHN